MVLVSVVRELMGVLFGELCWQNKGFIWGFFNPKALWTRAEPSGTKDHTIRVTAILSLQHESLLSTLLSYRQSGGKPDELRQLRLDVHSM